MNGWSWAHFRGVRIQRADDSTYHATPIQGTLGEGWPDLALFRDGRRVYAEVKAPGKKASDTQLWVLSILRAAGNEAYVWLPKDWDEVERVLRR
jgi:hypothetical protein